MMMDENNPFAMPVNVRRLPRKGLNVSHTASEDERKQIADMNDLISVDSFEAQCNFAPWKRDGVSGKGHVRAQITQACAVSGEPLKATIDEPVEILLVPDDSKIAKPRVNEEGEWVLSYDGEDPPDTFTGDTVDAAEIWLEHFALGIDPHLRHEGAVLDETALDGGDEAERDASPFAALAALKGDAGT